MTGTFQWLMNSIVSLLVRCPFDFHTLMLGVSHAAARIKMRTTELNE
jgi:hypothetical protein